MRLFKKSQNRFCIINFDKVYKTDNQSLLEYFMYGRFANAHINKTFSDTLLQKITLLKIQ